MLNIWECPTPFAQFWRIRHRRRSEIPKHAWDINKEKQRGDPWRLVGAVAATGSSALKDQLKTNA